MALILSKPSSEKDLKPHVGEVMTILVDELELYTNYAETLDKAVGLMTTWKQKSQQFAKIVTGIEVSVNANQDYNGQILPTGFYCS